MHKNDLIYDFVLQTRLYGKKNFLQSLKIHDLLCKKTNILDNLINYFYYYILMCCNDDYSEVEKVIDDNKLLVMFYKDFLYLIFSNSKSVKCMNYCKDNNLFTSVNNSKNYSNSILHCIYPSLESVKSAWSLHNSNVYLCFPFHVYVCNFPNEDRYIDVYSYFDNNVLNFYYFDLVTEKYETICSHINNKELVYMYNSYVDSCDVTNEKNICEIFLNNIFNNSKTVKRDSSECDYGVYSFMYKKYDSYVQSRINRKIEIS